MIVLCIIQIVIAVSSLVHGQQGPAAQSPHTIVKEEVIPLQRLIFPVPTPYQRIRIGWKRRNMKELTLSGHAP